MVSQCGRDDKASWNFIFWGKYITINNKEIIIKIFFGNWLGKPNYYQFNHRKIDPKLSDPIFN